MQELQNKTVIITGAAGGIGKVLSLRLAKEGCKLVLIGRDESKLNKLMDEVTNAQAEVLTIPGDVSNYEDVQRIVKETSDKFHTIDYLINNAALLTHKTVSEFTVEDWKKVVEVNLFGPFMMSKEVLPHMEKQECGTIVNICSTSGKKGYEKGTAYSASKFALTGFSESLFKEVRSENIRVTAVYPSYVDTDDADESKLKTIGKGVYLRAEDVADSIIFAMKLPQRAMIKEIELWGTNP